MTRDDVMEKLSKLFALSESDNEHEAALASQRAAELMAKHQLEAAEVYAHVHGLKAASPETGRIDNEDGTAPSKRKQAWQDRLGIYVAEAVKSPSRSNVPSLYESSPMIPSAPLLRDGEQLRNAMSERTF